MDEDKHVAILNAFNSYVNGARPVGDEDDDGWRVLDAIVSEQWIPVATAYHLATSSTYDASLEDARRRFFIYGFDVVPSSAVYQFSQPNVTELLAETVTSSGGAWNDEEIRIACVSYLSMLQAQSRSHPISKTAWIRELHSECLASRSDKAIEYRLQNISAVLEGRFGISRLQGYAPAAHVGTNVENRIETILRNLLGTDWDRVTQEGSGKWISHGVRTLRAPPGSSQPTRKRIEAFAFERDPEVVAWTLMRARGKCEGCSQPAPFIRPRGTPYLEVHHIFRLADGGPDTVENTVALCPNCHRRTHFSNDREAFTEQLRCYRTSSMTLAQSPASE